MNKIKKIFKKEKNIVIGALHFPPLLGFDDFPGLKVTLKNALTDLKAFEDGGVDGIFLENNYGLSRETISTPNAIAMAYLIGEIRKVTALPLGASVLWNDYETAFALAKVYNLQFIRIPVFVDTVKPYCGTIIGNPKKVSESKERLGAERVAIFADIHVKHAELLSKASITTSAKKALASGADAIIMTGKWTGMEPDMSEMMKVKKAIGETGHILVGSGASHENVHTLSQVASGLIVSTSLKKGVNKSGERNVKGYEQRIDAKLVKNFVSLIK